MIEPTEEMVAAFERFMTDVTPEVGQTRDDLAAVLAIVARDRCMEAAGHVYHPLARRRCDAKDGFVFCELAADHDGSHTASLGAGLGVSWS